MELTIDIPKGYIIDRENSTDTCIKLKKVEKPTSWEEYSSTKKRMEIYFTNSQGEVLHSYINDGRKPLDFDTKEELSPTLSFPSLKFGSVTYKIQVEDKVTIMAIESKSTSNLSSIIPSNTVMEDMINSYCSILNSLYR